MRVLSALVLTHCFGCVIPDDSDDDFPVKKSNLAKMKDYLNHVNLRDTNYTENVSSRAKNHQDPRDTMRFENYWKEPINGTVRYERGPKCDSSDEDQASQRNFDPSSDHEQIADSQNRHLIRHRRRIHRSRHNRQRFHRGFRKSNKKNSLNYNENGTHDVDIKKKKSNSYERREQQHPINRYHHKEIEFEQEDEGFQEDPEGWDDWTSWSECSVTCGQGRQVRWRHCSTNNCPDGLKMAQMRACNVQECRKKGFLKWLGLKL